MLLKELEQAQVYPTPDDNRPPIGLEVSLEPFAVNGRMFRVVGTQSTPHQHWVKAVDTGEVWVMPHQKIALCQKAYFLGGN